MNTRVPSVPLITCDPYFSVWSPADQLYGAETAHWTGRVQRISGIATIDGAAYRFMGRGAEPPIKQTALNISATSSCYVFEGAGVRLELSFLSPLLLDDLDLLSRPASYIGVKLRSTDGVRHGAALTFLFDSAFVKSTNEPVPLIGGVHELKNCLSAWMGRRRQAPLSHSGDDVTIDWGYLHIALAKNAGRVSVAGEALAAELRFPALLDEQERFLIAAYDDCSSINYFGFVRPAYWARAGKSILGVIEEAVDGYAEIRARAAHFDADLGAKARAAGGADYERLLNLAYRQSIAAHKLATDENGDAVFISKECFSNGCAATVDVSYPSSPLYLLYNPELVKGMLRPVLRFAQTPAWPYAFAPHDVGRYPYVTGQVYGLREGGMSNTEVYPPYYTWPTNSNLYNLNEQMPIEECGNMLIMLAALAKAESNAAFSRPYSALLDQWADYLEEYGMHPDEQLCTDDFAGHLAANCNLAVKAIMGIEAYALLLAQWGRTDEAAVRHKKAMEMADVWTTEAGRGDHTALVFTQREGWSMKYNLVWDKLFKSGLFAPAVYENELRWYLQQQCAFGIPLDSRRDYTKSDWILWTAAFTNSAAERASLIAPIAAYLAQTPDRVPFSDWYDAVNGRHYGFRNRTVQGGLFMPLLADKWR
jgi:hypothetical protein